MKHMNHLKPTGGRDGFNQPNGTLDRRKFLSARKEPHCEFKQIKGLTSYLCSEHGEMYAPPAYNDEHLPTESFKVNAPTTSSSNAAKSSSRQLFDGPTDRLPSGRFLKSAGRSNRTVLRKANFVTIYFYHRSTVRCIFMANSDVLFRFCITPIR